MLSAIVLDLALDAATGALGLGMAEGIALRAGLALLGSSPAAPKSERVLSAVPGRVRLRVVPIQRSPELARRVERILSDLPEVTRATANHITGSVVVEYGGGLLSRPAHAVGNDFADMVVDLAVDSRAISLN